MWVARDKNDGTLWLFASKPYAHGLEWQCDDATYFSFNDENYMPEVTFENSPKEVFLNTGYDMTNQINHVWAMLKCTQDELAKSNELLGMYREKFETLKKVLLDG